MSSAARPEARNSGRRMPWVMGQRAPVSMLLRLSPESRPNSSRGAIPYRPSAMKPASAGTLTVRPINAMTSRPR
jgi:hypothetical protein